MSAPLTPASASNWRLVWRPLRATSVMPFLWPSSSSSTIIGRKMSCSSKRNSAIGSCSSTLVSSTNSRLGPWWRALRVRRDGAAAALPLLAGVRADAVGRATAGTSGRAGARAVRTGRALTVSMLSSTGGSACWATAVGRSDGRDFARRADRSMTSGGSLAPRLAGGGGRGMRFLLSARLEQAEMRAAPRQRKSRLVSQGGFHERNS